MSRQAENGDTVIVHYTGKLTNNTIFDSSKKKEPLTFILGEKKMIPGFEKAVLGMSVNETKSVTIPFAEAYGAYNYDLITEIPRSDFPEDFEPELDEQIVIEDKDGNEIFAIIIEMDEETITIDTNHPLAGEDLVFKITLVDIL